MLAGVQSDPARRRRPTMRDVAQLADVSFKTVSRVVNDEPGVSAALTVRVRRAIDELGFHPHPGARLLRTDGRTSAIALLLEDVANPYSAAVQRAVENEARERGVVVFSASIDEDPARERALAREFGGRRVDGLVLAPAGDDQSYLADELPAGTPVVCVDREARDLAVDSVITTNALGAAEGVRHLAAAGHRRIAFLGDRRSIRTAEQRFAGYREALASLGLPLDAGLVVHDLRESADADGAVTALLAGPDPPTALFTAQNLITIGAVRALRRLGAEWAVALVGFDDVLLGDLLSPGITVVAQDPVAIGRTAATLLFSRIGGDTSPPGVRLVPTTLIRRGSGELPPR
ncbi:LacI family DNA-binding transcriptional regulator [Pseudonocardia kunmingensis]|uniref:LacI family transcriptional regulator n=1 Tax=Pseudonocardia kunmingensis TaxID=630975 RepID=A0A543E153_9PSEU|nr:LacI family DNA-binding transcriptional regulator [Pseudonocardia kunmingensis]TQM15323.1 LacI family transcriptional regulator [Pseudonocardia kunmingensis]